MLLVIVPLSLLAPSAQAGAELDDDHPFYQSLLDTMNSSERFLFKKRSYERTADTAIAMTDVYDLSPEATTYHLFTLSHSIAYRNHGQTMDISFGTSANATGPETSIVTTLDIVSLETSTRALMAALFGDASPFEITSSFSVGAVEHHLTINSAYLHDDTVTMRSGGFQASVVAQDSDAIAAYAALEDSAIVTDEGVSLQIERMLMALNVAPQQQGQLPLYEFSFNLPGAVNITAPFSDVPFTVSLRDIEFTTGFRHDNPGYGAELSLSIADAMVPFMPVQGAKVSMKFHGLSGNGKNALERFFAHAYDDGQLSDPELGSLVELLATQVLSPGLGVSVESGFKTFLGEVSTRVNMQFADQFHTPPAQWKTRGDMLRNVTATFALDANRLLYNLIPAKKLPEQSLIDRVVVFDRDRVAIEMRLEDNVVWLNGEPLSLSLIYATELQEPLWPDSTMGKHSGNAYGFNGRITESKHDGSAALTDMDSYETELNTSRIEKKRHSAEKAMAAERARLAQALKREERARLAEVQRLEERARLAEVQRLEEKARLAEVQRLEEKAKRAERQRLAQKIEQQNNAEIENTRKARQQQRQLAQLRNRYFNAIRQRVQAKWRMPPGNDANIDCTVSILQNRVGDVIQVVAVDCANGGDLLRQSVEHAVLAASPMPIPPDRALFDRRVKFFFRPG